MREHANQVRRATALGVTTVAVLVLAACQVVQVQEGAMLTATADRTTPVPLTCTSQEVPCEGTVAVRVGGLDSPTADFVIPIGTTATIAVVLTPAQYDLVPTVGTVSAEVVLDQLKPSDADPSASPILLRREPVAGAPVARVSLSASGAQASNGSSAPSLSGDGRFVAFESFATDLVPGSTGGQVFVKDRVLGAIERVSVAGDGTPGNARSSAASISEFARYVAFTSNASNLVAGDTNRVADVFVRDRTSGTTTLVSRSTAGTLGNGDSTAGVISGSGRWVVFESTASNLVTGDLPGTADVFLHDRNNGTTTRVSIGSGGVQPNGPSFGASISDDGRLIAFLSDASNLVAGDTNGVTDLFVRDRVAGTTTRVSLASDGTPTDQPILEAAISGDGSAIAFWTEASNLVAGDTNGSWDVFVRDLVTGTTTRVSVADGGIQAEGYSLDAAISDDGRTIAFRSDATNLAPVGVSGDHWDLFVHDRTTGTTRLAVTGLGATPPAGDLDDAALSGDGTALAFTSGAANLVADDTNGAADVFAQDRPA